MIRTHSDTHLRRPVGIWIPDDVDPRDHAFAVERKASVPPRHAGVSAQMPPVVDQGNEGSCTGNGMAVQFDFLFMRDAGWSPASRRFIYYNERKIEGTVRQDAGAMPRDGMKVMAKLGVPVDAACPYEPESNFKTKPTAAAFTQASTRRIGSYVRLHTIDDIVACIASGNPVGVGAYVYAQLQSDQAAETGVITMPAPREQPIGGHYFVMCEYDLDANVAIGPNSWSTKWGMPSKPGYMTVPLAYLGNPKITSDLWTIRR